MTTRRAGALAAVLLSGALAACGSGGSEGSDGSEGSGTPVTADGPPDAQTVTVLGTEGLDYEPSDVRAAVGRLTLTLTNEGGPPHDLAFSDDGLPDIGAVSEGQEQSATYVFASAGTFDFVCTFHPGMTGRVVVS